MVKVALAGGTGGLGHAIADALAASSEHDYLILTRDAKAAGDKFVAVDYNDVDSLTKTLVDHEIHTIVSALSIKTTEQSDAQLNLVRAPAKKAPCVKRFTPSEYGTPRINGGVDPTGGLKSKTVNELQSSDIEYTLFSQGVFMDYFGLPRIESHLSPWVFAIDIANKFAGIPGSGEGKGVYTYSGDVAKYVIASLSLPAGSWKMHSVMIGQRASLNEVLHAAESVRGKFIVHYDSMEDLQRGKITELASHKALYEHSSKEAFQQRFAGFGMAMEGGAFDFQVPEDGVLLNELFPEIVPKSIKDVITEGWA